MRSDLLRGVRESAPGMETSGGRIRRGARSGREFRLSFETARAASVAPKNEASNARQALLTAPVPAGGLAVLCSPPPKEDARQAHSAIAAEQAAMTHVPTVEEVFGGSPFVEDPQGQFVDAYTGQLRTYGFNPIYFATESAAQKLAEQLGGTVVERNAIVTAYFTQAQPNRMILLPNGREINAGLVAHFYTHGYPQSYIDRLIAQEIDPDGQYGSVATPVNIVRNGVLTPAGVASLRSA